MKKDWEIKNFERCLQKVVKSNKIAKKNFLKDGKYPIISQESNYINGYWNTESDVLKVNSPVVVFGDHTKIVKYIDFDFVIGADGVKVFLPIEEINTKFFLYQINNIKLRELGYARHYRLLKNVDILIPPIDEQKEIVALLDKAFASIEQAKANIEQNIQNAKDLFQSKLNQIFSQRGNGWEEKTLGEVSNKIMYGYTSKVVNDGNVKYVRITDIQDSEIDWDIVPFINITDEEKDKYILSKGDIVFARTGATTGKSYLIKSSPIAVFASYLIRVQCKSTILIPSFLYLFFQSGIYWDIVKRGISGSAQGGFNASKLGKMNIHFPTNVNEQTKYVTFVDKIKLEIDFMITNYKTKVNSLEELKKSLLQKAFNGELT